MCSHRSHAQCVNMDRERYDRGWEKLKAIHGEEGERFIENVKSVAPDLAQFHS